MEQMDFTGLTGFIVTPLSPEYEKARQEWNHAIDKYPIAIVYVCNENEISNAVKWCRSRDVCFRIRSGGHNYAGYSTGDGVLVIDVSRMNKVIVNSQEKKVIVHAGANNEAIYNTITKYGSYPFPGGTCPTVGISGLTAGGGIGLSCRKFGLACDNVDEMEIIDYKGELIKCSSRQNCDLFWALRGAGDGNFGVITSITFKLPDKVDRICLITFDNKKTSRIKTDFINRWQNWLLNLDNRISMFSNVYNKGISGKAFFYGNPGECWRVIKPLVDIPGFPISIEYIPFIDAVKKVASEYPPYQTFQSSGRFIYRTLCIEEIRKLISIINNPPKGSVYTAISLYSLGGAVRDGVGNENAFFYRNARYILGIQTIWEDKHYEKINKLWFEKQFSYIEDLTIGSYVNFPYTGLKNYEKAYWGGYTDKLRKVKQKYDPFNIFRFPQSLNIV